MPIFDYDFTLVGDRVTTESKRLLIRLAKVVNEVLNIPLIIFTAGSAVGPNRPYNVLKSLNPLVNKYDPDASVVIIGQEGNSDQIVIEDTILMLNGIKYLKNFYDVLIEPTIKRNIVMLFFDDMNYHNIFYGIGKGAKSITRYHSNSILYYLVSMETKEIEKGNMIKLFIDAIKNNNLMAIDDDEIVSVFKRRSISDNRPYRMAKK